MCDCCFRRRAFPDALAHRCLFFEPTDAQGQEDKADMPELMMFPPTESGAMLKRVSAGEEFLCSFADKGLSFLCARDNVMCTGGPEQLSSHAEVVMLDFATAMLSGLEQWMLTAGPAMIDLNTFCDTSDKLMGSVSVLDEVQKRLYTDEVCVHSKVLRSHEGPLGDCSALS